MTNNTLQKHSEAVDSGKVYDYSHFDHTTLHQITELADFIRSKGYGIDVREAMAQALERVYADASSSGNSNMEVAKSRGTFDYLPNRLDDMTDALDAKAAQAWVDAQLKNIISANPTSVLANLATIQSTYPNGTSGIVVAKDSGKWYYWNDASRNWLDGGVYQAQGLDANSVTSDEIDFTEGIKQMLSTSTLLTGGSWRMDASMVVVNSADWGRFSAIRLYKGKTYYIYNARGFFTWFISLDGKTKLHQFATNDTLVTTEFTPSQDGLLYVSTNISRKDVTPKVFNASVNELKAAQVDFANLPDGYVTVSIPKLSLDVKVEDLSFVNLTKQLLDEDTLIRGVYYTGNKTDKSASATWGVYPPVYLQVGKTYGLQNVRGYFAYFFNNNDKMLKRFAETDRLISEDFTPTENGYLLITRRLADSASKLILGGLSKIDLLPNLEYGASALETTMPLISQKTKTDFTVKQDGTGDFTSLVTAINTIGEGTAEKPLTIYVYSGTYDILEELGGVSWLTGIVEKTNRERLGITVPDYVNIVGVGDVKLTLEVPDDVTTTNTAKRISLLNVWRHNTIKNLKLSVRNTRYAVHDETNNSYHHNDVRYIDCYFEHKGNKPGVWQSTQAYAAGTGNNGNYLFENCTFKSASIPFSMHDNANQDGNTVKIRKCTFISGDAEVAIRFGSHGANTKMSTVTIENCNIDKGIKQFEEITGSGVGNHFKISGGGNTVVPYININSIGRKERIEFAEEVRTLTNSSQTHITIGAPVKLVGNTVQPLGADESYLFYGVSLDDITPSSKGIIKYAGYIAKEDTELSQLELGQKIGIVNGRLAVTENKDFIAYATDTTTLLIR